MPAAKTDPLESSHEERVLVVGKGVVLTANVTSCDKVIVEGQFQGNIKTGTFILTEGKTKMKTKSDMQHACLIRSIIARRAAVVNPAS